MFYNPIQAVEDTLTSCQVLEELIREVSKKGAKLRKEKRIAELLETIVQ